MKNLIKPLDVKRISLKTFCVPTVSRSPRPSSPTERKEDGKLRGSGTQGKDQTRGTLTEADNIGPALTLIHFRRATTSHLKPRVPPAREAVNRRRLR